MDGTSSHPRALTHWLTERVTMSFVRVHAANTSGSE